MKKLLLALVVVGATLLTGCAGLSSGQNSFLGAGTGLALTQESPTGVKVVAAGAGAILASSIGEEAKKSKEEYVCVNCGPAAVKPAVKRFNFEFYGTLEERRLAAANRLGDAHAEAVQQNKNVNDVYFNARCMKNPESIINDSFCSQTIRGRNNGYHQGRRGVLHIP